MRIKVLHAFGYLAVGLIAVFAAIFFVAPKGPSAAKDIGAKYYNLIYAMSSCPSATPRKYDNDGVTFDYFLLKDAPNMERRGIFSVEKPPLERGLRGYTQDYSYIAGNIFVNIYAPGRRGAAKAGEMLDFARAYAERSVGMNLELSQDCVNGAPFSACFRSGPRDGLCFASASGRLYCFTDQDMAMQDGRYPFWDTLICSIIGSGCALDDYASFGMKAWFFRPAREKLAECNFLEMKKTVSVKGKP